jgi:hypothetical protein
LLVPDAYSTAIPASESNICRLCYFARSTYLSPVPYVHILGLDACQAVKDVSASFDALVELLECIGNFLNRLDIYTKIPPTAAMTEVVVKIMVELISTLALVTKQVKQGRPSECVSVDASLN